MSFALPTLTTVVDKHVSFREPTLRNSGYKYSSLSGLHQTSSLPTLWQVVSKYDSFRELVRIARMEDILNDPQANMTIFVPLDLIFPRITLQTCVDHVVREKDVINIDFECARTMVNSVIVPSILTTTTMMQSAFTRYKTRDSVNTLTTETPHCVQLEPTKYTRPPFNIILNCKSRILAHDIPASNGVVHTIDKFPYH